MSVFWTGLTTLLVAAAVRGQQEANEQFFLDKLFAKYGDQQVLSFEGFEHLMENLGLGELKFEKAHTLWVHRGEDGKFHELHDLEALHRHNHSRLRRSAPLPTPPGEKLTCLSPQQILVAYGMKPNHEVAISPRGFLHICPAIVHQLDQKVCSMPAARTTHVPPTTVSSLVVWIYASASVLIISVCGLFGVLLVPLLDKAVFKHLISTLVAVAVGTLCGDALLHLLPHALEVESKDHSIPILRSSTTFLTVMFFFFLEAIIHGRHGHSHHNKAIDEDADTELKEYSFVPVKEGGEKGEGKLKQEGAVGHIVVIGDALHNLTDGLAVGAAFRADITAGLATAVAVFTHELPHELGDFAVLLKSGMSVRKAVYFNILSSVISFIGMAIGIYLGNFKSAAHWIYAATAGSFLYIALADLVPELHKYRAEGKGSAVQGTILQLVGTFIGGGIMFLIAVYEESLYTMFS